MSCRVGCRQGLDPALLWLWCRPAATAPIRPLVWEPPYAAGAALEMAKKKKGLRWLVISCHEFYHVLENQLDLNGGDDPRVFEFSRRNGRILESEKMSEENSFI